MMTTAPRRFSGERLREARGERKREELAMAADCTAQTILNWEAGTYEPPASALAAIAALCGRDLDFFFVEENPA